MYDNMFPQMNDTSMFDSLDISQFSQDGVPDFTDMDGINTLGTAVIPRSAAQDRRTQLLLMGWPLHLPEPEVTRHL